MEKRLVTTAIRGFLVGLPLMGLIVIFFLPQTGYGNMERPVSVLNYVMKVLKFTAIFMDVSILGLFFTEGWKKLVKSSVFF